jgi:integrase/recombinase XerD
LRHTVERFARLAVPPASMAGGSADTSPREVIMPTTALMLPLKPDSMSPAQLAAVSYLARYSGSTHLLYKYQLRWWFDWCQTNCIDPLVGIARAHVELYIRHLTDCGLMPSSVNTMMHGPRGFFGYAHIDGLIAADPAVYARLPKVHSDESRTQGLDRLELIRSSRWPGPPCSDSST